MNTKLIWSLLVLGAIALLTIGCPKGASSSSEETETPVEGVSVEPEEEEIDELELDSLEESNQEREEVLGEEREKEDDGI